MNLKNTSNNFGLISIIVHWTMALLIIAIFTVGVYMEDLEYYDNYYHIAPWWHKSFGMLLAFLLLFRIIWRISNPKVKELPNYKSFEIKLAKVMQYLLYLLIFVSCFSGYLISTADDVGVDFFNFFNVPAWISKGEDQADLAGEIHEYSTLVLIIFAGLHALAALKHHFIDKDKTLTRIFKTTTSEVQNET